MQKKNSEASKVVTRDFISAKKKSDPASKIKRDLLELNSAF